MLDSRNDGLTTSRFVVCEMETLLSGSYGEATVMAVLLYLFRRMERALDGSPTLVPIDEAWLFLKHPAWRDKIQDWLKTLRKKNAVVVLSTQSMADIKESPIASAILQSTATKIYLPNSEAGNEGMRQFYEYAGLNSREIELLQTATPKRDYYVVQRLGRRMISFRLGASGSRIFRGLRPEGQSPNRRPSQGIWRRLDLGVDERKEGREKLDRLLRRSKTT